MVKRLSGWQWFLISLSCLTVLSLVLYIALKTKDQAFPIKTFFYWLAGLSIALIVLGWLIWYFFMRKIAPEVAPNELAKEYVGSNRAIFLWKQACMKETRIPTIIQHWNVDEETKEPIVVPADEDVIEIRNETEFVDPSHQTADRFLGFQAIIRDGIRRGVHFVIIRTDLGEKYITENWNARMRDNMTFNRFDLHNTKYPLTGAKSAVERLMSKRIELQEQGYSEEDLQETFDPLIRQASDGRGDQRYAYDRNMPPIDAEEISEKYPQMTAPTDQQVEVNDIQQDIKDWQQKKK